MSEDIKKPEGEQEQKPTETTDKTIGEITGDDKGTDKKPEPEMVPLSSLLEFKTENKELKKSIAALEAKVNKGDSSKEDIADDLEDLAKEFDIEPKFISKLTKILEARAEKKADEKIAPILERDKTLTKKEQDEKIDKAFKQHYEAAMEKMPEFAEIANADVIKSLSLLPANANKTFAQLIEETYGKAISGKRTIEPTKPAGGKDPEPIDFDKARSDTEYFKEIMADPEKKKQYNERMLQPNRRR